MLRLTEKEKQSLQKRIKVVNECWEWQGKLNRYGYGRFAVTDSEETKKERAVHRVTFELQNGEIPEGLVVHHKCSNRICCNVEHLELTTRAENVRLGDAGKYFLNSKHCKRGHVFTEETEIISFDSDGNKIRDCKKCIEKTARHKDKDGRDKKRLFDNLKIGDGCWEWTGRHDLGGYGVVWNKGKSRKVHRVVYRLVRGKVPEGLCLDHLCRVRHCANPDHLEPVTNQENIRRGRAGVHMSERTHCKSGHEFTEENTYWHEHKNGHKHRMCRECGRLNTLKMNEKAKSKRHEEGRSLEAIRNRPTCANGHPWENDSFYTDKNETKVCKKCLKETWKKRKEQLANPEYKINYQVTECKNGHSYLEPDNVAYRPNGTRYCKRCRKETRIKGGKPVKHRSAECKKGHLRTPENTTTSGDCRTCMKERRRKNYLERKISS